MASANHEPLDEDDLYEADHRERVLPLLKRDVYKNMQKVNGKQKQAGQSRHAFRSCRSKRSGRSNGQDQL